MSSDSTDNMDANHEGEPDLITPEMRAIFLKESEDVLDQAEQALLHLSDSPNDRDAIALVFRSIHSFKGNCGFFGYAQLERAAHRLETALDTARNSVEPMTDVLINASLGCLDIFRKTLTSDPQAPILDPEGVLSSLEAWEDSMLRRVAALNVTAMSKLAGLQLELANLGMETVAAQQRLLSTPGSLQQYAQRGTKLAGEYGERIFAISRETADLMLRSGVEFNLVLGRMFGNVGIEVAVPRAAPPEVKQEARPAAKKAAKKKSARKAR